MNKYRYWLSVALLLIVVSACKNSNTTNPVIEIKTSAGNILVELYADKAPETCAAFLSYIDENLYENSSFYRVLNRENQSSDAFKSELIQGGIWEKNSVKAQTLKIPHEPTNRTNILHTRGTISLARQDTGTAGSEFFILLKDDPSFDYGGEANADKQGYAAFGKVIKGMDIVYKIYDRPTSGQRFEKSVPIYKIKRD